MPPTGPTFLVAGVAKAGTTSLAYYLRQHPDIFVAREKESHHFAFPGVEPRFTGPGDDAEMNRLVIPQLDRYLDCFTDVRQEKAVGEASVYYVYQPESLERALAFNPEMRFIVVLREPLARAYSAFSHNRRDQWEPVADFASAVAEEEARIGAGWSYGWHYARVSDYAPQLKSATQIIPPGQLRVILYDDLVERPVATLQELFRFLDVDDSFVCDTSLRLNMSGRPRFTKLNLLLGQSSQLKDLAKRMVPYRVGLSIQQRVRNWNLRPEEMDEGARSKVEDLFRYDANEITDLTGLDVASWSQGH